LGGGGASGDDAAQRGHEAGAEDQRNAVAGELLRAWLVEDGFRIETH
jgi:hypothetical protein